MTPDNVIPFPQDRVRYQPDVAAGTEPDQAEPDRDEHLF